MSMLSSATGSTTMRPSPAIGRMEVTIIQAHNLPQVIWSSGKDGEFLGLPQAYCVFTLNKLTAQTVINKRDWSPSWNHTVSIDVRDVWQVCSLKVMHSKTLSRTHNDDFTIGNVSLPAGQVINWRGVSLGVDGYWRAFHRPYNAGAGTIYTVCQGRDRDGAECDRFETAEEAASAYDDVASKRDREMASLNFSGEGDYVGQHVKEEEFPLAGEDGVRVDGVQAGVAAMIRLRLKFFMRGVSYLEVTLERAASLPKMDAGLGSCDAYCHAIVGGYTFKSRLVRNSLDPKFQQTFRINVKDEQEALELKVQIWDWDRFDEDDHMGDAVVRFAPRDCENGALDGAFPLMKPQSDVALKNGKGQGSQLHLRFAYFPSYKLE
uniref:C2 domain-containing protein n=1 Tax=Hemiselmis tepida TaxID=464990 RepID=A0A7S0Z550_9CRYP